MQTKKIYVSPSIDVIEMEATEAILALSVYDDKTADPNEAAVMTQRVQVIRYAVIVISTLPIMCMYPFLQKYFVQGVMIGSLKG